MSKLQSYDDLSVTHENDLTSFCFWNIAKCFIMNLCCVKGYIQLIDTALEQIFTKTSDAHLPRDSITKTYHIGIK